ncbi:hypothetical protein L596_003199 [Steinernema carpocapsae]|uniref:Uncharacterized protein n=1 Tax=Steinernema carpocapsae TaxID=34508 RepID=A0A4U8UTF3_STECR|nr:hypothetical protein L596_003199 [Steinernema carpocapsae]
MVRKHGDRVALSMCIFSHVWATIPFRRSPSESSFLVLFFPELSLSATLSSNALVLPTAFAPILRLT